MGWLTPLVILLVLALPVQADDHPDHKAAPPATEPAPEPAGDGPLLAMLGLGLAASLFSHWRLRRLRNRPADPLHP